MNKLDPMQVAGGLIVGGLVGWWLGRRQVAVVTTTVPVVAAGGQVLFPWPDIDLSEPTIARWLAAKGLTCEVWMALPRGNPAPDGFIQPLYGARPSKQVYAQMFAVEQGMSDARMISYRSRIISAIDAHCAKVLYAPRPAVNPRPWVQEGRPFTGPSNTRYARLVNS